MFPLPIPHEERKSPLEFIPDVPDPTGTGGRMWKALSLMKITQGRGAGQTFGATAPPWQEKFVRTLFAEDAQARPLFSEAFLTTAKKQGKTSFSGALAVAYAVVFQEQRGSVLILAASKDQAGLAYDAMASTVEADPFLLEQFHVRRYRSDIVHRPTGTILKALASELAATVGSIPSFYIIDELHLLGRNPKGANLVRQLSSGAASRERSMGLSISTAPVAGQLAAGIFKATHSKAQRILSGEEASRTLPVLFELPPGSDPDDPRLWWMSNPSLGTTVTMDWLREAHTAAKSDPNPHEIAHFYSQHLNIQISESIGVDRWIPVDLWDGLADPSVTLGRILADASVIHCGTDAGGMNDPTSIVVTGAVGGETLVWSHQWLTKFGYTRNRDHNEYDGFISAGELTVVGDIGEDIEQLLELIRRISETGRLGAVGVDPYGLKDLSAQLERSGVTVYAVRQGWQLTPHIDAAERLIYAGSIRHAGKPMLRWNLANARIEERNGARALTKPTTHAMGTEKIDGAICLILAVAVMTEGPAPSAFNDPNRDLIM